MSGPRPAGDLSLLRERLLRWYDAHRLEDRAGTGRCGVESEAVVEAPERVHLLVQPAVEPHQSADRRQGGDRSAGQDEPVALLDQEWIHESGKTVGQVLEEQDAEIGQGSIFDGFDWGGGAAEDANGAAAAFAAPQHPPIPTEDLKKRYKVVYKGQGIGRVDLYFATKALWRRAFWNLVYNGLVLLVVLIMLLDGDDDDPDDLPVSP